MNAAIEKSNATIVHKCFCILCILLVSSNPVKAFNSSYFKKTGDELGGIQQLLTGITTGHEIAPNTVASATKIIVLATKIQKSVTKLATRNL